MKIKKYSITLLFIIMIISSIALSGCGDKKYTVKFNDNYSYLNNQFSDKFYEDFELSNIKKGSHIVLPNTPKKRVSSYKITFQGWYKDRECTEKWIESDDVVNSNITLYAKWIYS